MSTSNPRNYSTATKRQLDMLSGGKCYCPECNKSLIRREGKKIFAEICHIEAASSGGPRFNKNMSDDDRRHFDNLILLCRDCHDIIDTNLDEYPVSLLKQWKQNRELEKKEQLSRSRLLEVAMNAIINSDLQEVDIDTDSEASAFKISEKIKYNDIKRNKFIIEDYKAYHAKLSSIYSELENQGSFKKDKLLRKIKDIYLKKQGKYIPDYPNYIEGVRMHADDIIDGIQSDILNAILNVDADFQEDIVFGVNIIMVDAFMRCKILEEPK